MEVKVEVKVFSESTKYHDAREHSLCKRKYHYSMGDLLFDWL